MARYPGARWRPVARYQPGGSAAVRMSTPRRYILHTAVSAATSLYSWFSVAGRATSHFYIARDGTCEQYIDTAYRSTANLQGNHDCITVESQDMGSGFPSWSGSNVPSWSTAQVEALARLGAWIHDAHGIPLTLLSSSRPGTRGVGYHRQGIDPWRVTGGEVWSNARGKVCPGDRRVAQVPAVIARAKALASGSAPAPGPQPKEWWEMSIPDSEITRIADATVRLLKRSPFPDFTVPKTDDGRRRTQPFDTMVGRIFARANSANNRTQHLLAGQEAIAGKLGAQVPPAPDVEALAAALLDELLPMVGDQVRDELREVTGVDEDEVAARVVARFAALLTGSGGDDGEA